MTDKQMERYGCLDVMTLYLLAIGLMAWALCGCTATQHVPVERVRTEYVEADTTGLYDRLRNYFESIYRRETVVLKENGDTTRHDKERIVYVASYREKELEHKVEEQDSTIKSLRLQLESVKSDSIPIPYPVEKQLSKWEQTKMDFGGIAIGAIIAVVCVAVVWLIRKFRK